MFGALVAQVRTPFLLSVLLGGLGATSSVLLISMISRAVAGELPLDGATAAVFFGLVMLSFVVGLTAQRILGGMSVDVVAGLRATICGRLLCTPYERLGALDKGRIYGALVEDISAVQTALSVLPVLTFNVFLVIAGLAYLGYLSLPYFAIFVALLTAAVVAIRYVTVVLDSSLRRARDAQEHVHRDFSTLTGGIRELTVSHARRHFFFHRRLSAAIETVRGHSLKAENARALLNNVITMVVFTVFGVLLFGVQPVLAIDAATLAAFIVTLLFIRAPIGIAIDAIPVVLRLRHSLRKLEQLELASQGGWARQLDKPVAIVRPERLTLRAQDVCYRFADSNGDPGFAVGPCSFELESGQALFLVGGNGSGKSTLAHLLTGLYLPQAGALTLNGIAIGPDNLEWYRSHVGVIFSDFCLFDFAVGPAGEAPSTPQVDEWLRLLELHHKLRIEQGIVSTTDLSHGQRKRLALLAAYLESKPILVLDEWAADQDPAFKSFFYTELIARMKRDGRMLIVITHDETYFHLADRLYQMQDGRLHARPRPAAVSELRASTTNQGEVLHVQ